MVYKFLFSFLLFPTLLVWAENFSDEGGDLSLFSEMRLL